MKNLIRHHLIRAAFCMWQHRRRRGENQTIFGLSSAFFVAGRRLICVEYDGNVIGPRLRELRQSRKMTLDKVSELTGLSISTLKQVEQGGRRLSMASLYLIMTVYGCDANTVLSIPPDMSEKHFLEMRLDELPEGKKEKCRELFEQIIDMLLAGNGGRIDG